MLQLSKEYDFYLGKNTLPDGKVEFPLTLSVYGVGHFSGLLTDYKESIVPDKEIREKGYIEAAMYLLTQLLASLSEEERNEFFGFHYCGETQSVIVTYVGYDEMEVETPCLIKFDLHDDGSYTRLVASED